EDYSRIWMVSTLAVALVLVTASRLAGYVVLRRVRSRGKNLKSVVVVEGGQAARALRSRQAMLPEQGFRIVATLALGQSSEWHDTLRKTVIERGAHEVWLCLPLHQGEAIKTIMHALRHHTIDIRYLPDLGDLPLLNHQVSDIAGLYALDISRTPMEGPARLVKRLEDLILGALISMLVL